MLLCLTLPPPVFESSFQDNEWVLQHPPRLSDAQVASAPAPGTPPGGLSLVAQLVGLANFWLSGRTRVHAHLVLSLPKSWQQPFLQGALVPFPEKRCLKATLPGLGRWREAAGSGGRASDPGSPLALVTLSSSLHLP